MILVTILSILGAPYVAPSLLRKLLLPVLGVMLGSGFHPGLFAQISDWLTTIAILPLYVAAAFVVSFFIYRRLGKFDGVTAYFSSAPGGLTDMMIIGAEAGGVERRIALAHASRILIVVSSVTAFYALAFGISATGNSRPYTPFGDVPLLDLAILLACAVIGAWAGPTLRLPAPQIIGPMILSGVVHLMGISDAPPPTLAVNSSQLVIGTVVGCRFVGVPAREVIRDLALACVSSTAMLLVAFTTAIAVSFLTGIELRQTVLTFAPGGLPEMSLLSLAMGADVAFVATIHILRITIVIAVAPMAFRALGLKTY